MILFRKGSPLRVRRTSAPVPPYWCATSIAPYGTRRWSPFNLDLAELRVSHAEKAECGVCDNVSDELERMELRHPLAGPVVIDAATPGESVYKRGDEAARFAAGRGEPSLVLVAGRGAFTKGEESANVVVAWPADAERVESIARDACEERVAWGLLVPVVFPLTTDLALLEALADIAASHGATFLAATSADLEAGARGAIARTMTLDEDDERYVALFHADPEAVQTATERHVAALAHERGLADFVFPPRWHERSNWNGAILLTLTATRMLAMEYETELAGTLARSARLIASLGKPITRVAELANLSIIEPLDEVSVDILTEWLETGRAAFVDRVNERWRLRRDYVAG